MNVYLAYIEYDDDGYEEQERRVLETNRTKGDRETIKGPLVLKDFAKSVQTQAFGLAALARKTPP